MDQEYYELRWKGRRDAEAAALSPADGHLVQDGTAAPHRVIVGDNLPVAKLLGTVDAQLVFLDPPYNTGRQFAYDDNFRQPGDPHSAWLSFVYPRLVLARQLLAPEGFLVATIDDNEGHHLRLLLDEVFGEEHRVGTAVWQRTYVANQTARGLSDTHDYVMVYARDIDRADVGRLPRTPAQKKKFKNPDDDPRGPWKAENLSAGKPYSKGTYAITTPSGRVVHPPDGRWWRCSEARYQEWLGQGRIWFGADGKGRPMLKKYLAEVRSGLTPDTWWPHDQVGSNKEASIALKRQVGARFETPKPVRLLRRILTLFGGDPAASPLIVDLFAGAGVTGEAVLQANAEDGGTRRFILVEQPGVADVCIDRLRTVPDAEPFRVERHHP